MSFFKLITAKSWLSSPRLRRRSLAMRIGTGAAIAGLSWFGYEVYTEIHRLHTMQRDFLRDHVEPFGANMPLGLVGDCVLSLASWNTGNPMEQKRAISNLSKALLLAAGRNDDTRVLAAAGTQLLQMVATPRAWELSSSLDDVRLDSIEPAVHLALLVTTPASLNKNKVLPHERLWAAWLVSGPAKSAFVQKLLADAVYDQPTRRGESRLPPLMEISHSDSSARVMQLAVLHQALTEKEDPVPSETLAQCYLLFASCLLYDVADERSAGFFPFDRQDVVYLLHSRTKKLLGIAQNEDSDDPFVRSLLAMMEINLSALLINSGKLTGEAWQQSLQHANRAIELSAGNSQLHSAALQLKSNLVTVAAQILTRAEDAKNQAAKDVERVSTDPPSASS